MEQMISNENTKIGASSSETSPRKRSLHAEEGFVGKKIRTVHKESRQSVDEGDIKVVLH